MWKIKVTTQGRDPGKRYGSRVLHEYQSSGDFSAMLRSLMTHLATHFIGRLFSSNKIMAQVLISLGTAQHWPTRAYLF